MEFDAKYEKMKKEALEIKEISKSFESFIMKIKQTNPMSQQ
jgi:hypothetical protein